MLNKADHLIDPLYYFKEFNMSDENNRLDISDEMIAERRQGTGKMPDDMPKWMANTINTIDKSSKWIGNVVCWITVPLMFAMVYEVFARKLFLAPTMWAYDMSRFFYGALFMLGAGYACLLYTSPSPRDDR